MTADMSRQLDAHLRAAESLRDQLPLVERIADKLIETFRGDRRVYLFGNGGSAADSQHIAAELAGRFKRDRKALPAMALTTDTSVLTAVCNDLGIEQMFARQVEALVRPGDVVWALSVSGSSPNVLCGLTRARQLDAFVIGFTSASGTAMADLCDLCLMANAEGSDRVQEVHELAYHLICDQVERGFA